VCNQITVDYSKDDLKNDLKKTIDDHGKAMLKYGQMLVMDPPKYRTIQFAEEKQRHKDNAQDTRKIIHKMIDSL